MLEISVILVRQLFSYVQPNWVRVLGIILQDGSFYQSHQLPFWLLSFHLKVLIIRSICLVGCCHRKCLINHQIIWWACSFLFFIIFPHKVFFACIALCWRLSAKTNTACFIGLSVKRGCIVTTVFWISIHLTFRVYSGICALGRSYWLETYSQRCYNLKMKCCCIFRCN